MPTKLNIDLVKNFAKDKGGECTSEIYVSTQERLNWRCANGHTWTSDFANTRLHWCPECRNQSKIVDKKRILGELHIFAEDKNGECLSTEYSNSKGSLTWKCENGHVWTSRPASVLSGLWCRICKRISNKNATE